MSKKDEIPNFYRDPKTGRYFRERPEDTCNSSFKKLKMEREEDRISETSAMPLEVGNLLKFLSIRELGRTTSRHSEIDYYRLKTRGKKQIDNIPVNTKFNILSVDFIKGDDDSVIGVWNAKNKGKDQYVVGEQKFEGNIGSKLEFRVSKSYISDICEGPENTVMFLYNQPLLEYFERGTSSNAHYTDRHDYPAQFFCCATGRKGFSYAVGSEGFVKYYAAYVSNHIYPVKGRVHTISFDDSANLMASGVHRGALYLHDVRATDVQRELMLSDKCLVDSHFLDSHNLILAGLENKLFKVDLRMDKVATEYFGHQHSVKKMPFSIASNMLCVNGADNVIRIWHTSGGNPINEISPDQRGSTIRGWLHSNGHKTFLHYFERHYMKIFQI